MSQPGTHFSDKTGRDVRFTLKLEKNRPECQIENVADIPPKIFFFTFITYISDEAGWFILNLR